MSNCTKDGVDIFKNKKIWGFEFLEKSLKWRKSFKFIKEKLGGAILKWAPFWVGWTDFVQIVFKSCEVGKVKKFEHMVAFEKNVQSRTEEAVGL